MVEKQNVELKLIHMEDVVSKEGGMAMVSIYTIRKDNNY